MTQVGHAETGGPPVRTERRGPVSWVLLNSPHNANALSVALTAALHQALVDAGQDDEVRAVVVTGEGRTFCGGADLRERRAGVTPPAGAATFVDVLNAVRQAPKPVIARVNGAVRGGGIGLVAASDLAVAPASSTFAFSEVRVGVAPATIAVPLARVAGRRALARHMLTGETFGAEAAVAAGILNAAVPEVELDVWVADRLAAVLACAPGAVAATKSLLARLEGAGWDEALDWTSRLSDELFAGNEGAEGMAAFLERRRPAWFAELP